jgi:hypothetical protein
MCRRSTYDARFVNLSNAADQIALAVQRNRDCHAYHPSPVAKAGVACRVSGATIGSLALLWILMTALDWSQCPAVESVPGRVSGAWMFRNSRTPVQLILENLEEGMTGEKSRS